MAASRGQLEALKAEATKLQSRIPDALTKDEALELAITAADLCMKALKLATNKDERSTLRSSCKVLLDEAERIKATNEWPQGPSLANPPPVVSQPLSRFPDINLCAKTIPASFPVSGFSNDAKTDPTSHATSTSDLSLLDLSINDTQAHSIREEKNASSLTLLTPLPRTDVASSYSRPSGRLHSASIASPFDSLLDAHKSNSSPRTVTNVSSSPTITRVDTVSTQRGSAEVLVDFANRSLQKPTPPASKLALERKESHYATTAPSNQPMPRIRRLAEPVSTRPISKKEEILLLRASKFNGFAFPPWKSPPVMADFVLADGAEAFVDTPELDLSSHQLQFFDGWVRAKDALPPPAWLPGSREGLGPVMGANRPIDLVQDAATDCSVVASLCAGIARVERGHDRLLSNNIWPFDEVNGRPVISPNGKYVVRLNFNGCWRKVVIDDRLPLSKTNRMLHVIDRKNPALLWPALLEKAYLKVRGGYDFPGSNSCSDLWALTGWIPEQIYLQEGDLVPSQLWTRLYKAFLYGDVLLTVGTGKMAHRAERELGLEGQHNYVVLDMKETDHDKLFLVKNPWVEGKGWRGNQPSTAPTMDASSSSSGGELVNPASDAPNSGTFWIGLHSLLQHFESLYLNWNPGLFKYRQDIPFSWDLDGQGTDGGCIVDHPQFLFHSMDGGVVWFLLCRHFGDAPPGVHEQSDAFNDGTVRPSMQMYAAGAPPKGYMSISIYNRSGEHIYVPDNHLERGPYVNTPQSLLRWECEPKSTYTLVINQDDLPTSSFTFTLSAFSNSAITLERATQKYPIQTRASGSWTQETAGGNTHSPKYFDNPQFSLKVSQHTPLVILIQTREQQSPVHVKLVHGRGKRIYDLQSRDIIIDSGEHRNMCAFAEVEDISPGSYTIICSMFEAGKLADFSLRVDSTVHCELKAIPRDGAGLTSIKLDSACFGPSINKIAVPIVPRRLAGVTIVARFLRARSPRFAKSPENEVRTRSPLRMSIEMGRGPERIFLRCSSNGEYSDAPSVRTDKVDLSPSMLYSADLWLVLDRLSGPGTAVEEWYDIEIFADAPNACSAGVWRGWDD